MAEVPPPVALGAATSVHVVGVGGAGMSTIAVVLAALGHRVSGADKVATGAWPSLSAAGVDLEVVSQDDLFGSAARSGAAVVTHSTAYPPSIDDVAALTAEGAVVVDRAGILASLCALRESVAVSGTHGKTSTTAMLATLLDGVGADPSFLVGGVPVSLGEAARWGGDGGLLVVEADESDGTFERLGASTVVVTNVEEDHLDFWGSIDAIEAAFDRFLAAARHRVVCIDVPGGDGTADPRTLSLATRHGAVTVGEAAAAQWRVHSVQVHRLTTTFGLCHDGTEVGPVAIATPGRHHALNAAVAVATAATRGIDVAAAVAAVGTYRGVGRRFEVLGERDGVTVVDDYAHNPGKVRALLASAAGAGWGRVVVVFQPHRYSRTRTQGADLGRSVAVADLAAVTDVYGAGEPAEAGVSGRIVLDAAREAGTPVVAEWTPTLDDALSWARSVVRPGDLLLTAGAGDVRRVGEAFVRGAESVGVPTGGEST